MCDGTPTCIAVIIAALALLYLYQDVLNGTLDDDCSGVPSSYCPDGSCDDDFSSSSCDPDPRSRVSCCALNPIINSQMQTLTRRGGGDNMCLPNLGSKYLGATVASTRNTIPYKHPLGSPSSEKSNKPSLAIEPGPVVVGKNWHFVGVGSLVVKLFYPAHISGFAVVHAPKCQIPTGYESSAPKNFLVMGMNDVAEEDPFLFGNYTYSINGVHGLQTFPVQSCSKEKYQLIEFQIHSNHGNPDYTALYQVRIYGYMGPPPVNNDTDATVHGNQSSMDDVVDSPRKD